MSLQSLLGIVQRLDRFTHASDRPIAGGNDSRPSLESQPPLAAHWPPCPLTTPHDTVMLGSLVQRCSVQVQLSSPPHLPLNLLLSARLPSAPSPTPPLVPDIPSPVGRVGREQGPWPASPSRRAHPSGRVPTLPQGGPAPRADGPTQAASTPAPLRFAHAAAILGHRAPAEPSAPQPGPSDIGP